MIVWLLVVVCIGCASGFEIKSVHATIEECELAGKNEVVDTVCLNGVLRRAR